MIKNNEGKPAQLVSYSDTDAERVFRAFWRRIHTYVYFSADQAAWPREFPEEVPPHFRVHMRTALCALPEAYSAPSIAEKPKTAEERLQEAGVFKGAVGLRKLTQAQEFWEKQPYGTRLYYGPQIDDYVHRGVLIAAVQLLDTGLVRPEPPEASNG